jgi:hypothetical protein
MPTQISQMPTQMPTQISLLPLSTSRVCVANVPAKLMAVRSRRPALLEEVGRGWENEPTEAEPAAAQLLLCSGADDGSKGGAALSAVASLFESGAPKEAPSALFSTAGTLESRVEPRASGLAWLGGAAPSAVALCPPYALSLMADGLQVCVTTM